MTEEAKQEANIQDLTYDFACRTHDYISISPKMPNIKSMSTPSNSFEAAHQ